MRTHDTVIMLIGILFACLAAAPTSARAEDDPEATPVELPDIADISLEDLLEQVVVATAGKRAQDLLRSPSAVSVITRGEIAAQPYMYLGELLATLPGFDTRRDMMQRFFIGMRGLGGSGLNARTLLLVDGQPRNDPLSGEASAGHWMPLANIERIEVIRGPGSSLYGANAFTGVVNVITRHGTSNPSLAPRVGLVVGSDQTVRAQASGGKALGPVDLLGSVAFLSTDGHFQSQHYFGVGGPATVDNDDLARVSASASAALEDFRVALRFMRGERGRPGQFPTDSHGELLECSTCHTAESYGFGSGNPTRECGGCHLNDHDREQMDQVHAVVSYDHAFGDAIRLSASAYDGEWRTRYDVDAESAFLEEPDREKLETRQRMTGAETHLTHTLGEDVNTLLIGAEIRSLEAASHLLATPEGESRVTEFMAAAFLEDEVRPVEWLSLVAGVRVDHNTRFGHHFSPRGGIVFAPGERGSLRFSVARAFRNPNFAELYIDSQQSRVHKLGSPHLEPEWLTTLETGATWQWARPAIIRLSGSAFYTRADSLIGLSAQTYPEVISSFTNNTERADVVGGELELNVEHATGEGTQRLTANYSIQDARGADGRWLPYAPRHKLNVGLFGEVGPVGALVRFRYVDKRLDSSGVELPPFTVLDLAVGPEILEGLFMKVWARNLTDHTYQDSLGIPAPGRSLFLELRYEPDAAERGG
ncbi:MAG: TonB-dependent receptor [Deltaproteobacteria bacterium]|nr:TonB-dependent receptor [Deltaproteobacteria bacterium]